MTFVKPLSGRIASIDIFRALTMLLMVFVNDLAGLTNIPGWLKHTPAEFDGMGLSDVVFPAFLFIVGLSIPHAIRNRMAKGENSGQIAKHIFLRSFALIAMGFFHVNLGYMNHSLMPVSRPVYEILLFAAFFLIWNTYPASGKIGKLSINWFRGTGILLLVFLAAIFRGGTADFPVWMKPHWWGILGLIGWAYLFSALVILFSGNRWWFIALFALIFHFLNYLEFAPFTQDFQPFRLVVGASNHALVLTGAMASVGMRELDKKFRDDWVFIAFLLFLCLVFTGYGWLVRPLGGISKIKATPSWTAICAGISFAAYALLYLTSDILRLTRWAGFLKPAGTSTLTCYLVPYLVYPVLQLFGWQWPEFMSKGGTGLLKSFLFSLAIIWITGLMERMHVKLKI